MKNQAEKTQQPNINNPFVMFNPSDGCHYDFSELLFQLASEVNPKEVTDALTNVMDAVLIDFIDRKDIKSTNEFMDDMFILKILKRCFNKMTVLNTNKIKQN